MIRLRMNVIRRGMCGALLIAAATFTGAAQDGANAQDWCAKYNISIPAEVAICGTPSLIDKERETVELFKQLGGWANSPLKQEQKSFLESRNKCESNKTCLALRYDTRIAQLKAKVASGVIPVVVPPKQGPVNACLTQCLTKCKTKASSCYEICESDC
jgi:uncharacterized protein